MQLVKKGISVKCVEDKYHLDDILNHKIHTTFKTMYYFK